MTVNIVLTILMVLVGIGYIATLVYEKAKNNWKQENLKGNVEVYGKRYTKSYMFSNDVKTTVRICDEDFIVDVKYKDMEYCCVVNEKSYNSVEIGDKILAEISIRYDIKGIKKSWWIGIIEEHE